MSNNRQQILASLFVATLVLSLATIALATDDAQAGWKKKISTPRGDNGGDANGENSPTGNGQNGGTGTNGGDGGSINCDRTGCH